jgi:hypothetical protein
MPVVRALVVMLLVSQRLQDALERPVDLGREDRIVPGPAPVPVGEPDRIKQRIDLELALDDFIVGRERIRIRVDQNVASFAGDDAAQGFANPRVRRRLTDIRFHHGACVAQPFRFDVAGRDVGRPVALARRVAVERFVEGRKVDLLKFRRKSLRFARSSAAWTC